MSPGAHFQDVPLLKTKLHIPPVRPELVSRPRLIERLNAGLGRKLTLISAPAGFGKTQYCPERGRPMQFLAHKVIAETP